MNFLIDAQLPPGLGDWLVAKGHLAEHVFTIGLADAADSVIWNHALKSGAVVITKDEDFAERNARSVSGPVIIWLRVGNSTNRALVDWLELRWPSISRLLQEGHRLIEVR